MIAVLAQNSFGDTESDGIAGPLGLFIIVLLVVATVLLIRNMNKRIKRLPDEFPAPQPTALVQSEAPLRGSEPEAVPEDTDKIS